MTKRIKSVIWFAVALTALAILANSIDLTQLGNELKSTRISWIIGALAVYLTAQTTLAFRWLLLLGIHNIHISAGQAVRLTYLGLFYNNLMPGAVGGDLLKGWYITHHCRKDQRLEAVVSVLVDRLIGLIGMIFVGAAASCFVDSEFKFSLYNHDIQIRRLVWSLLAALCVVSTVFLSKRIRRIMRLSHFLKKIPFNKKLKQIDQAVRIYRRHTPIVLAALLLTSFIQGLAIVAVWMITQALHCDNITFLQCLMILPVIWLISAAIPLPGALGSMEALFILFFAAAFTPESHNALSRPAAIALLNRLMICFCSIPGAVVPLFGGHLPKLKEIENDSDIANIDEYGNTI